MWGSRHIERLWTALRARFDERGAVMVEYALIIGLIGIIAIPGLAFFGPALHDSFVNSAQSFDPEDDWKAFDRNDCMNGGWQSLTEENGPAFSNQGQCVSYANNY
jgi:Flp pilus assembly pilin Flp